MKIHCDLIEAWDCLKLQLQLKEKEKKKTSMMWLSQNFLSMMEL